MTGPLARYARWQLKDYAGQRAAVMLVIATVLGYPSIVGPALTDTKQEWARALAVVLGAVIPIGTLLAIRGVVSDDRHHGYYRFIFAKPVSVARFYAQSFLVQLAGFAATTALVVLVLGLFSGHVPLFRALAAAGGFFALVGGLGFLFSVLFRRDWLWTLGTLGVAGVVRGVYESGERWLAPLVALLPPVGALGDVLAVLDRTVPLQFAPFARAVGYGAACLAAGLYLLRRRSLTK